MKSVPFFFKNLIFDGRFKKYINQMCPFATILDAERRNLNQQNGKSLFVLIIFLWQTLFSFFGKSILFPKTTSVMFENMHAYKILHHMQRSLKSLLLFPSTFLFVFVFVWLKSRLINNFHFLFGFLRTSFTKFSHKREPIELSIWVLKERGIRYSNSQCWELNLYASTTG